jgi:hypothetical protein
MHDLPISIFIASVVAFAGMSIQAWLASRRARLQVLHSVIPRSVERDLAPAAPSSDASFTQLFGKLGKSDEPNDWQKFLAADRLAKANIDATRKREETSRKLRHEQRMALFRFVMQIVTSLMFLGASVYIILSHNYDAKDKHWAYGTAGTILGY